jgi:hypothetical protein
MSSVDSFVGRQLYEQAWYLPFIGVT